MVRLSRYKGAPRQSSNHLLGLLEEFMNDISSGMKADIKENADNYVMELELPGVNKNEIRIQVEYDKVTVSVERNEEDTYENETYLRKERRYDSRARSFKLSNIITDKVKAYFNNGILTIIVPKKESGFEHSKIIDID